MVRHDVWATENVYITCMNAQYIWCAVTFKRMFSRKKLKINKQLKK